MNYRNMAKHFLFDRGASAIPTHTDRSWLVDDGMAEFTNGQLAKLADALHKVTERARQKLIDQRVINA